LGWLGGLVGIENLSLELLLSYLLAPVAWLMGVPWADCGQVGVLLGKKTILNEFIAYLDLQTLIEGSEISQRSIIIATYALCGFANIGSIGIQIGGIGGIAPNRQHDLARLGVRAMIAGSLACFMTASIAGMLL
jgi:concentrative nucleoside transporter, CNT family